MHAEVLVGVLALGAAWMAAWFLRRQRPPRARALAFFAGLAVFVGATTGPLHDAAERYLFSAHMLQHLLLTLVGPPLLLAGTPPWMGDALLGRGALARAARAVTRPVPALVLYSVALAAWHFPGPYDAALGTPALHALQHATMVGTAVLAWWPVLAPATVAPPVHYGAQILYLFALGMPMTVVAAMITGADGLLYTFYADAPRILPLDPLEDQRLGGLIMWVPAGVIPLVAFTAVYFRWAAAEREDAAE
jgi:putative membrane protein